MIKEIVKRGTLGIAFGGICTFIALTVMKFAQIEGSIAEVWKHMLASFIIGIYFGVASLIFEKEQWSALKQTLTHYFLSIIVWLFVALPAGWLPVQSAVIVTGIIIFTALYAVYWLGFYIYFKKVEASLNKELQEKK